MQYGASRHITPLYFPNINYFYIEYLIHILRRCPAAQFPSYWQVSTRLVTAASCMTPVPLVSVQVRPLVGGTMVTP